MNGGLKFRRNKELNMEETLEEIHRFLAVIGQSSKTELVNGQIPDDYIGRFGIGLLSCFMVSDSITVHTRSYSDSHSYMWRGFPDGTYTLGELEEELPVGTTVMLEAKPGRGAGGVWYRRPQ